MFFYFVESQVGKPLAGDILAKDLASVGLGHLADPTGVKLQSGKHFQVTQCPTGPSGKPGTFLWVKRSDAPEPKHLQYNASEQTWIEVEGQWIGWANDRLPGPEDLLRERPAGFAIARDLYDRSWQIPVARMPDSQFGGLSTFHSLTREQKIAAKLHPFEVKLWESAEAMAPRLLNSEDPIGPDEAAGLVILALGRNYRLSFLELAAFESMGQPVLDASFIPSVLMAVCHFDFLIELQKKTQDQ